jgi:hypothetical protein
MYGNQWEKRVGMTAAETPLAMSNQKDREKRNRLYGSVSCKSFLFRERLARVARVCGLMHLPPLTHPSNAGP